MKVKFVICSLFVLMFSAQFVCAADNLETTAGLQHAYILNNTTNSVTVCKIGGQGLLLSLLNNCNNIEPQEDHSDLLNGPIAMAFNSDEVYILNTSGSVVMCATMNGSLSSCTPVAGTNPALLSNPYGIAINNNFVYITNTTGNSYTQCKIDTNSGNFSACGNKPTGSNADPFGIAINDNAIYMASSSGYPNYYSGYLLCANDAANCNVDYGSSLGLTNPMAITINNGYMYITDMYANDLPYAGVTECTINTTNGQLTNCNTQNITDNSYNSFFQGIAISNNYAYITDINTIGQYVICPINPSTGTIGPNKNCSIIQNISSLNGPTEIVIH